MSKVLSIENLHVAIDGKEILKGVDLTLRAGEVHALMGPNGSGKSTLAQVIAGRESFEVLGGEVRLDGVGNLYFLRTALNAQRRRKNLDELDAVDFLAMAKEKMKQLEMDERFMNR